MIVLANSFIRNVLRRVTIVQTIPYDTKFNMQCAYFTQVHFSRLPFHFHSSLSLSYTHTHTHTPNPITMTKKLGTYEPCLKVNQGLSHKSTLITPISVCYHSGLRNAIMSSLKSSIFESSVSYLDNVIHRLTSYLRSSNSLMRVRQIVPTFQNNVQDIIAWHGLAW